MWANHTRYHYPEPGDAEPRPHLTVDYSHSVCKQMVDHWVSVYLSHPNYYRLPDGRLFVSIYSPQAVVNATGSPTLLFDLIDYLRSRLRARGLPDVHVHACEVRFVRDAVAVLARFNSCSDYLALGYSENVSGKEPYLPVASLHGCLTVDLPEDERLRLIRAGFDALSARVPIPYHAVAVVGRDCSPRWFPTKGRRRGHYSVRPILREFNPARFRAAAEVAREYLATVRAPYRLLFVTAWNEWTEGAYLEPDTVNGLRFLDVVRDI